MQSFKRLCFWFPYAQGGLKSKWRIHTLQNLWSQLAIYAWLTVSFFFWFCLDVFTSLIVTFTTSIYLNIACLTLTVMWFFSINAISIFPTFNISIIWTKVWIMKKKCDTLSLLKKRDIYSIFYNYCYYVDPWMQEKNIV